MSVSFSNKLKTIFELISNSDILTALISQKYSGYLLDIGWFNSFKLKRSVDKNNNPIPWTTYPFIDFINEININNLSVFEYGSGNSTLYWSKRVKKVDSLEHNKEWYEILNKNKPNNVSLHLVQDNKDVYPAFIKTLNTKYDMIFVDAIFRNECVEFAINNLTENGILILDDSERPEYLTGIKLLEENNFKKLNFWGIAPSILFKKCTTIFYKSENCLGI